MSNMDGSFGDGSCAALLRAFDLLGLADSIGSPGPYTCYRRLDLFDLEIGILPGNFSAEEVADLYKAAAFKPTASHPLPIAA
jgi:hypothetical protein